MYFKMYFFMFMTLCLFGHVEAKCLANTPPQETTSSSVKVCSKTYTCEDLTSYIYDEVETFEQDGCTVLKCPAGLRPSIFSLFTVTEILKPTNANSNNLLNIYAPPSTGEVKDMFSQFEMECDGYVTKYPLGINYLSTDDEYINRGQDGSYDGMKTEVMAIGCSDITVPED